MTDQLPKSVGDVSRAGMLGFQIGPDRWEPLFLDDSAWSKFRLILSSWLGTPYRHCTMVKGRGADCTLFIGACWVEYGILTEVTWDYYSKDWHLNTHEEKVLDGLYDHFTRHSQPGYAILRLDKDAELIRGDVIAFALTPTGVSNHASVFLGPTDHGELMLHAMHSKGVSVFPVAGFFERHKSNVFRIMRRA